MFFRLVKTDGYHRTVEGSEAALSVPMVLQRIIEPKKNDVSEVKPQPLGSEQRRKLATGDLAGTVSFILSQ
ncbi:hypothetical protein CU098_010735 [Rhizopus stolonifer]|uniref:Uncharacterized protein n=1 Tax=Rhizopus stolonifer TaxID=4846 RepID=A0A367KDW5_RHIST|nr:hypothetical protein CU098_010735 [Rhizopus stolonifer]